MLKIKLEINNYYVYLEALFFISDRADELKHSVSHNFNDQFHLNIFIPVTKGFVPVAVVRNGSFVKIKKVM